MSDTIITAVIAGFAGALAAYLGQLGSTKAAKIQIGDQHAARVFHVRLEAYTNYFDLYEAYLKDSCNAELLADLLTAVARARLVASPECSEHFRKASELFRDITPRKPIDPVLRARLDELLYSMQLDLNDTSRLFRSNRKGWLSRILCRNKR